MDLNEIKKLIEDEKGKIIIIENGEPVMVITSFNDYKKNKAKPEPLPAEPNNNNEELKIEDLPF